jgi:dihydrofolate reductase/thymidylate synthase
MSLKLTKGYSLIVAADQNNAIGKDGQLPWPRLSTDLKSFFKVTKDPHVDTQAKLPVFFQTEECMKVPDNEEVKAKKNAVVMGRNTWDSLPNEVRPLKGRINVILTKDKQSFLSTLTDKEKTNPNIRIYEEFDLMMTHLDEDTSVREIVVIGGASLYTLCLENYKESCKYIVFTRVNKTYEAWDTFINPIDTKIFKPIYITKTFVCNEVGYDICFYGNAEYLSANPDAFPSRLISLMPKHEEMQYLEAINDIIKSGNDKDDRTGTGVISKFGYQMRYDLSEGFPMLTTKNVYWKGVVEELLWFLRGDTNANNLSEKKVKIWDGNGSREFLDKSGFTEREEGDLGPVYGFQWRHFGADYSTMHGDYQGQGVDQIQQIVKQLKEDPTSRRILLNAWNVADLEKMALPPCHILCQFYVDTGNKLSWQMYQRSCDIGLGVPFNIASYSLLTCMIAQMWGLERGEFIHTLGDAHVYKNHIEPLKKQLKRYPSPFPQLKITREVDSIDDFKFEDFELIEYKPQKKIKMPLAV